MEPRWREIAWPYPRDGWPAGRAFHCPQVACGGDVEVYVRPKLGFCNCDTGVADDDEVDRVADIDLISPNASRRREAGHVISVAEMPGRLRSYDLVIPGGVKHVAVGIAVSHRCDLLVAVAQGKGDVAQVERAALEFLGNGRHEAVDDIGDGGTVMSFGLGPFYRSAPSCPGLTRASTSVLLSCKTQRGWPG